VTEDYVWYGTNEYNFEKLPDPPAYKPTKCADCAKDIVLSEDEYSNLGKDYFCSDCTERRLEQRAKETKR
jgi:DNA-directed RNA polymerase subunit RPC12/RpoP